METNNTTATEHEITMIAKVEAGMISSNYEEIKKEIEKMTAKYEAMAYGGENTIAEMKDARARLNRLQKQIKEREKVIKNDFMIPLSKFSEQVAQLVDIIKIPTDILDEKIKDFEAKEREERKKEIEDFYFHTAEQNGIPADFQISMFSLIYSSKWENKTTTKKTWKTAINDAISQYKNNIALIESMNEPDFFERAVEKYQRSLDVKDALEYISDRRKERENEEKLRIKLEAEAKARAEAKAQREMERKLAEERERIAAEEKAKAEEAARKAYEERKRHEEAQKEADAKASQESVHPSEQKTSFKVPEKPDFFKNGIKQPESLFSSNLGNSKAPQRPTPMDRQQNSLFGNQSPSSRYPVSDRPPVMETPVKQQETVQEPEFNGQMSLFNTGSKPVKPSSDNGQIQRAVKPCMETSEQPLINAIPNQTNGSFFGIQNESEVSLVIHEKDLMRVKDILHREGIWFNIK